MKKYYFLVAVCATTLLAVAPMTSHASEDVSPSAELPINPEIVGQMEDELNNALNDVQNGLQPDIIAEKEEELNNALNDVENGIQPQMTIPEEMPQPSVELPFDPEVIGQMEDELNNALNDVENGIQPQLNVIGEPATPELPSVPGVADPMPMPLDPETNMPMLPSDPDGPGVADPMPMPLDPETNMPMLPSADQPLVELEDVNSLTNQLALGDSQTNTPFVNLATSLKNNDLKTEKAPDETVKGEKTFPQTGERSSVAVVASGLVMTLATLVAFVLRKFK